MINELKRYFHLKALHVACGVVEIGVEHVSVTKRMFPLAEAKLPFVDICWLFLKVDGSESSVSYALARMRNRRPDIGFHFADGTFPSDGRRQPAQAHCSNNQRPASDFGPTRIEHGQE